MAGVDQNTVLKLKQVACEAIDKNASELHELNKHIWKHPEVAYKERNAHEILTSYLAIKGFDVTRQWTMDTAFGARYGIPKGPCVGIFCEYDALPLVGHACGHNLIAEAGVAASIGIKAAMDSVEEPLGNLLVAGTPAEESGGGKIQMLDSGCFSEVDFAMMVHPCPFDVLQHSFLSCATLEVIYKGHAAHAAAFPSEGVNALDAAIMAYNNISTLRQQMKPAWRVHGIIVEGGVKPNIIPDRTKLEYSVRTEDDKDMETLKHKVMACFEGAAQATGCSLETSWKEEYKTVKHNPKLVQLYQGNAESLGVKFLTKEEAATLGSGSTDMGNVSQVLPAIHPMYGIETKEVNHSHGFTAAAGTDVAHQKTLIAAKAMAMTTIDVICCPDTFAEMKRQFARKS
ncbi:predicted protein [Nematostella vectensis]|uniref:Peptidase M20 domain-containing protein 2 n=1 Tax=Nematostella vectensis TaxID=45351 RepID=A7RT88_NEMVE|nr:peptidase M20 domain-containing protein 2 [Nematostella vectensis]EDO45341.1 predicted protein [Nematostella vectensis]|eukprot:XP_001637404.1 predicted protein [Nematostella vectensis]